MSLNEETQFLYIFCLVTVGTLETNMTFGYVYAFTKT